MTNTTIRYLVLTMHLIAVFCLPALAAPVDDIPVVVLRSDDIRGSWAQVYPELDAKTPLQYGMDKHIPVTWGTIVDLIGKTNYLSAAQLNEYLSVAGGEIASHSVIHAAMPTNAAYIQELVESKAVLKQMFPVYFKDGFIQPGYWLGDGNLNTWPNLYNDIGIVLRSNYKWSGDYLYVAKKMGGVVCPYGMCTDFSLDYPASVDSVIMVLNEIAKVPGLVYIFTCHGIQPSNGFTVDVRANVLEAFMNIAAQLRDEGKIHFVTQAEAIEHPFPANVNCILNGGFESGLYWWNIYNGATTVLDGNSGSATALDLNSVQGSQPAVGTTISIRPAKYNLSWYQRVENTTDSPLDVRLSQTITGKQSPPDPLLSIGFRNSEVGVWQPRQALLVIKDGFVKANLTIQAVNGAHYLVDDVTMRQLSLDPALSATNTVVTAKPALCLLSWKTPNSNSVTSIMIRVGAKTHPLTPSEGTLFAQINPALGSQQSASGAINWSNYLGGAYFSVFAMTNTAFAPPDIAFASEPQDISYIRSKQENASAVVDGAVVSAAFTDCFYIESKDRINGIRVEKTAHGLVKGLTAGITGSVKTDINGERYISATNAIRDGYGSVLPLGMGISSLGGASAKSMISSGISQKSVTGGGYGPFNIGLLVKTWGVVTVEGNPFVMSDGSKALVSVMLPLGVSSPAKDDFVVVTGISSCLKNQSTGEVTRLIRATEVVGLNK